MRKGGSALETALSFTRMQAEIAGFNAVILASVFNPSVFRETWLVERDILAAADILPGFLFSEQAVHVPTARYTLTVIPQQLQFAPAARDVAREIVPAVVGQIVRGLPHTPLTAVGLNFIWRIDPEGDALPALTRRLFLPAQFPLAADFTAEDARFGVYCSKNVHECRLRLDIKPAVDGKIQLGFNFNRDVASGGPSDAICAVLDRWTEFDAFAEELVTRLAAA